jgi:hypothetical protein
MTTEFEDYWGEVHRIIGTMSDFERGWYHALINTLWWNSNDPEEAPFVTRRMPLDGMYHEEDGGFFITGYSPSGQNTPAPHFYMEGSPAPDQVRIIFDPEKFRAVWAELDSEAAINYYRLIHIHTIRTGRTSWQDGSPWPDYHNHDLEIQLASTESNEGLPEDWEDYPGTYTTVTKTINEAEEDNDKA